MLSRVSWALAQISCTRTLLSESLFHFSFSLDVFDAKHTSLSPCSGSDIVTVLILVLLSTEPSTWQNSTEFDIKIGVSWVRKTWLPILKPLVGGQGQSPLKLKAILYFRRPREAATLRLWGHVHPVPPWIRQWTLFIGRTKQTKAPPNKSWPCQSINQWVINHLQKCWWKHPQPMVLNNSRQWSR